MIKSPCFNCPNRTMSCYSKCEPYNDYRVRLNDLNRKKAKAKKQICMVDDCLSGVSKMKMYKGW